MKSGTLRPIGLPVLTIPLVDLIRVQLVFPKKTPHVSYQDIAETIVVHIAGVLGGLLADCFELLSCGRVESVVRVWCGHAKAIAHEVIYRGAQRLPGAKNDLKLRLRPSRVRGPSDRSCLRT